MKTIELYIDEENEFSGIEAISVVENPAIEEDFIALKKQQVQLAEVDKEKRILMGAALIPNKKIYRNNGEQEYNIFFSEETVRKASELFLSRGKQNNSTLEHDVKLNGLSVVESWIVEDKKKDKSRKYGFDLPVGTWMVSVKVNNDEIWNDFVKEGKVKGFSIEGFFADKLDERPRESVEEDFDEMEALSKLYEIEEAFLDSQEVELESYNDYPQGAVNNAKRALKYKKENGSSCGTSVGWRRASQLANKQKITRSTIARMASFKRHQQNKDVPYSEGCGGIMWDAWGGSAGVNWAISKLKQIDKKKMSEIDELELELQDALDCNKLTLSEDRFSDYPEKAHQNALRALKYKVENKIQCGTKAGWQFAQMLAKKEPISRCLISQMASYVRFRRDKNVSYEKGCGKLLWDAWGGDAGINWATDKIKEIDRDIEPITSLELASMKINEYYAIIDDRLAYSSKEKALEIANNIGCEGFHEHDYEGKTWYMPCESHSVEAGATTKSPCWDGYEQKGYQIIDGKRRPNCVKKK
jgi:hypothetical protein